MAFSNFDGTWTLTQSEYQQFKADSEWLGCLEAAGVDNWEGYEIACQLSNGEITEDDI